MLEETRPPNYTEIPHKWKGYNAYRYSPETAAGILEIDQETLWELLDIWGNPDPERPSKNHRKVTWLDLIASKFLIMLGAHRHIDTIRPFMHYLIEEFDDRFPVLLEDFWNPIAMETILACQQKANIPEDLQVFNRKGAEVKLSTKAERFLNRIRIDKLGIVTELILLPPTKRSEEPILITPNRFSGYPIVRGQPIEFINALYKAKNNSIAAVLQNYHMTGVTRPDARRAIKYAETHYIEPI